MRARSVPNHPELEQDTGPDMPPFLPGTWTALSADLTEALRQRAAAAQVVDAAGRIEAVQVLPLPFFPGWMLCDLHLGEVGTVHASEVAALAVLYGPDGFTSLEDPRAIARHIEAHGLHLSRAEDCLLYAQFAVAVGALGDDWSLGPPQDPEPTVEMPQGAAPSALDAVRAPEAARVRLGALDGDVPHAVTIRIAADGGMTILDRETLDLPVQGRPGQKGPMRVASTRKDGA
jgi:hypothetical protein